MKILKKMELIWKHRGQPAIYNDEGPIIESSHKKFYYENAYDFFEVCRRGTDLVVDAASEVNVSITGVLPGVPPRTINPTNERPTKVKQKRLETLLNFSPNPEEDISAFRRQIYMDLILTGNAFIYFDGVNMWHLPAKLVNILSGKKQNKVSGYEYDGGNTKFSPDEVIHIKDNSGKSVYKGESRLRSATDSIRMMYKIFNFQEQFFTNGAIPGLILTTPNILGNKIKNRLLAEWQAAYKPESGGRRPMILDGDLKVNPLSQVKYNELDLEESVSERERKILIALGVPPILIESGNNANIRPNLQLFYETTVLPLTAKFISALESYFGYDLEPDVVNIRALRPEMRDAAQYYTGLVNAGIITVNEARAELRLSRSPEEHADELRIPANIAGSAVNPGEGGRPPGEEEDDNDDSSGESND